MDRDSLDRESQRQFRNAVLFNLLMVGGILGGIGVANAYPTFAGLAGGILLGAAGAMSGIFGWKAASDWLDTERVITQTQTVHRFAENVEQSPTPDSPHQSCETHWRTDIRSKSAPTISSSQDIKR